MQFNLYLTLMKLRNLKNSPTKQIYHNTILSGHNLDAVVDTLTQNFSEGSEYFKMLVNVFATEYRHFRKWYCIHSQTPQPKQSISSSLLWFSSATEFFTNELDSKTREKDNIKITIPTNI